MLTLEIEVTPQDITFGSRQSACFCPVALAIRRAAVAANPDSNRWDCVGVGSGSVRLGFHDDPARLRAELPTRVGREIGRYDAGYEMSPMAFTLEFSPVAPEVD